MDFFFFNLCMYTPYLEDFTDVDHVDDKEYLTLPPTLTVTPKEMNEGLGLKSYTRSLARKKNSTLSGHLVLDAEEELSKHSLQNCNTPEELKKILNTISTLVIRFVNFTTVASAVSVRERLN